MLTFVETLCVSAIKIPKNVLIITNRNINESFSNLFKLKNYQRRNSLEKNFRSLSSSNPILGIIPEGIRQGLKTSILDKATTHNSNIWSSSTNENDCVFDDNIGIKCCNEPLYISKYNKNKFKITDQNMFPIKEAGHFGHHHIHRNYIHHANTFGLESPLNKKLLNISSVISSFNTSDDPLKEWHINVKPKLGNLNSIKNVYRFGIKSIDADRYADPFKLSEGEMQTLCKSIRENLLGSTHPYLTKVASYFFKQDQDRGKKIRPMMILLLSRAMVSCNEDPNLSPLYDHDPYFHPILSPYSWQRQDLPQAQRRLAEISEMIHTASLLHDDVIDDAHTRRQLPSIHKIFGNKMAILAGDYLLARASIFLAKLKNVEVVETMSTIIEHLVRGEVMQMKDLSKSHNLKLKDLLDYYMTKNFYKTASLMANSCKSAAILGGYSNDVVVAAYNYGKHLGVAFQLIDDVLDFEGNSNITGKPPLSDLTNGLTTAPVLFAAEMYPSELRLLINRKFKNDGDVRKALEYVRNSDGIEKTKKLALVHAEIAIQAILKLRPSVYRDSLVCLVYKVVDRTS